MRYQSWRQNYAALAEAVLAEDSTITREALAEELAVDADTLDEIVERIRPTANGRTGWRSIGCCERDPGGPQVGHREA
jgi:hypothetical protein